MLYISLKSELTNTNNVLPSTQHRLFGAKHDPKQVLPMYHSDNCSQNKHDHALG